jgi:two-component sensor histidine kinase
MSEALWVHRPPPEPEAGLPPTWTVRPETAADLTALRGRLHETLRDGGRPAAASDDDVEWLLLTFEELASNALRHGRPPVQVTLRTGVDGWLLEVTDAAPDHPPAPAIGRDPARGGLGLYLVARLATAHGWTARGTHKQVWARIRFTASVGDPSVPQPRPGGSRGDRTPHGP